MKPLRRHQLVWLDEYAWFRVLASASSSHDPAQALAAEAMDCLAHWAQQRWPLVVTRQACEVVAGPPDAVLGLGLAAPAQWGRQSIRVSASLFGVARQGDFPLADTIVPALPAAAQAGWAALCDGLASLGVVARVYGSYGWQQLTGMAYVHAGSDIDLLIDLKAAAQAAQADQVAALLQAAQSLPLRIDGELAFANGAAVAWREWLRFRSGQVGQILVKRLALARLEDAATWVTTA